MPYKKLMGAVAALCICAVLSAQVVNSERPDALKEYNAGNYRVAIEICENELRESPDNLESYVVLCWALIATRQYSEAERRSTQARAVYPNESRLVEVQGEAKYFLDKKTEAMELFQKYIGLVSENANRLGRVYHYLGEIYILESKYNHADIALSMAVRLEPTMDGWWSRLGYAREQVALRETVPDQRTEEYMNALKAYNQALKLAPHQQDALAGSQRCQNNL